MKVLRVQFFFILLISTFSFCKERPEAVDTSNGTSEIVATGSNVINNYRYVMAPSGLTLREFDNLNSSKLALMPYGTRVKVLSIETQNTMTVGGIVGGMDQVLFNEQTGYVFNGYLSLFPMPKKDVSVKDYVAQLQRNDPSITYTNERNDPEFHEGYNETITLPTSRWQEGYYIAETLYRIPKSFGFPNPKGVSLEIIEEKNPIEGTWSSDLSIHRTQNKLDTISYSYRAEGYGWYVSITKPGATSLKIEHLAFAD